MPANQRVINFMGQRFTAAIFSAVLLVASIGSLVINGLQLGLDFTGGTQVEIGFEQSVKLSPIRAQLAEQGFNNPSVVHFGAETEVLVRIQGSLQDLAVTQIQSQLGQGDGLTVEHSNRDFDGNKWSDRLIITGADNLAAQANEVFPRAEFGEIEINSLSQGAGEEVLLSTSLSQVVTQRLLKGLESVTDTRAELKRSEFVGPQVGEELMNDGGLGLLFALAVVMVYVAMRFQFKFSVGAVAALIHDVIIVLGVFSILHLDFDLTVLAAVLAVIGYSLNDTIVVSDRIRENFRLVRKGSPFEVVNISLSQTLGRTLVTSFTTLLVLMALFLFGGELIHGFASALIVGVMVGTYSSIYVAANVLLAMNICKEDLMPPEKEGAELDEMP